MLTPIELEFCGFARFVEKQVVRFDQISKLSQVEAINVTTGGSSGVGKTTFLQVTDFLFDINSIPATELKSRLNKDVFYAKGTYDWDGKILKIGRGKKLTLEVDGLEVQGSTKILEEKLDEIIGMPRELFGLLLHKKQNAGGFFLNLTPQKIHSFLMECSGLSYLKPKLALLEKKRKDLDTETKSLKMTLATNMGGLEAVQSSIMSVGTAPIREIDPSAIPSLKKSLDLTEIAYLAVSTRHQKETSEIQLKAPKVQAEPFDKSDLDFLENAKRDLEKDKAEIEERLRKAIQDHTTNIHFLNSSVDKARLKAKAGVKAYDEAVKVAQEIKTIRGCQCPTCLQTWATDLAKAKEADLLVNLTALKTLIADGKQAESELMALEAEQIKLNQNKPQMTSEDLISITLLLNKHNEQIREQRLKQDRHNSEQGLKNQAVLQQYQILLSELRAKQNIELEAISSQLVIDKRTYEIALGKNQTFLDSSERFKKTFDALKFQESTHKKAVKEITADLKGKETELLLTEEAEKQIKRFASDSFRSILDGIADSATRRLRRTPNMENATLRLEDTKETADGKIKEQVNAVIDMDGEENIPVRTLSGGERTSTDLAIDFAFREFIQEKTNKGVNLFILDEPFNGLEPLNIEAILEILVTSTMDCKILIVDHHSETKARVDSKITVIRDGLFSRIEQGRT